MIAYVPGTVDAAAATDVKEVAEPPAGGVTGFVPKLTVRPAGAPDALNVTAEEKPASEVTFVVVVVDAP